MRTPSLPFLSIFKNRKTRKLYYLGKEDFYHSRNALNVPSSFNFHKEYYHFNFKTDKEIRFYGVSFGKSQKSITKLFGRPNYIQKGNLPLSDQTTLFYKLNIKGLRCTLQMHLFEDQLFFAQIQISDNDKDKKSVFLDLFRLKYKLSNLNWDQTIEDAAGSRIALKDDVVPKASFFTYDQSLWKKISAELSTNSEKDSFSLYDSKKLALRWS